MKKVFEFDKCGDFDRHIDLSIPNYKGLSDIFSAIVLEYTPPSGKCVDIGCSTGKFLEGLPKVDAEYIGVDVLDMRTKKSTFRFEQSDILDYLEALDQADVIVMMFTLQFLGEQKRRQVLSQLKRLVDNGTCLLIAEKVFLKNTRINHTVHREHIRNKRNGFTSDEILDKDYSLMGKMFCKTQHQIMEELTTLGQFDQVWQSYNFMGWTILK